MMPITIGDILEHKHARSTVKPYVVLVSKYTYDSDPADMSVILTEDFDDKDTCITRFREVVEEYLEYRVRGTNLYTDEPGYFYGYYDIHDEANNCTYSVSMFRRTV
jgi:hypothetical protein